MSINLVQKTVMISQDSSATTMDVTLASLPTAGNTVLVGVWGWKSTAGISALHASNAIVDNHGNTYTIDINFRNEIGNSRHFVGVVRCHNVVIGVPGTFTITLQLSEANINVIASGYELYGLKNQAPLTNNALSSSNVASPIPTGAVTATSGAYFGLAVLNSGTGSTGQTFTQNTSTSSPSNWAINITETNGSTSQAGQQCYVIATGQGNREHIWSQGISSVYTTGIALYESKFTPPIFKNLTSGSSAASNPSTTASITPAGGSTTIVTVAVAVGTTTSESDTVSVSGCGLTWSSLNQNKVWGLRRGLYVFKGTGTPSTGTLTITFTTGNGATWQENMWSVDEVKNLTTIDTAVSSEGTDVVFPPTNVGSAATEGDMGFAAIVHETAEAVTVDNFFIDGQWTALSNQVAGANIRTLTVACNVLYSDTSLSFEADWVTNSFYAFCGLVIRKNAGVVVFISSYLRRRRS